MGHALTWDATYGGLPLSCEAYAAHMRHLREFAVGRRVLADGLPVPEYQGLAALWLCGLVRLADERLGRGGLTERGRVYLAQREGA